MRYHYQEEEITMPVWGEIYSKCESPIYDECTLYRIGEKGLGVIQQRCDNKKTWWGPINANLRNAIYISPRFLEYFEKHAGPKDDNGCFPTVTVRQIMWALRLKPLKKERWETTFDRCPV